MSSDHEKRGHKSDTSAGEVRPLLPAAAAAHQLPITRPFAVIHQIIPRISHRFLAASGNKTSSCSEPRQPRWIPVMVVVVVGNEACRRTPGREGGRKNQCFFQQLPIFPLVSRHPFTNSDLSSCVFQTSNLSLASTAVKMWCESKISWTPNHVVTSEISLVSLQYPRSGVRRRR